MFQDETCPFAEGRDAAIAFSATLDYSKLGPMMTPDELRDYLNHLDEVRHEPNP